MSIILVQNEVTAGGAYDHWKDIEGVQYHFPNQYKGKVLEGTPFIYYRGVRRTNGKRGVPEYFGHGRIGRVWLDPEVDTSTPKSSWWWYCEIVDYMPFKKPVPFKLNETPFELIPANLWGVAVRSLSERVYETILRLAQSYTTINQPAVSILKSNLPNLDEVTPRFIALTDSLLVPGVSNQSQDQTNLLSESSRSSYAKVYGDRAEEVVIKLLTQSGYKNIRWIADEGEKPGWDIQYNVDGNLIAIEVKGTSGKRFTSIELTANEWLAAEKLGNNYFIFLVTDCLSKEPKVQKVQNPFTMFKEGKISIAPIVWRLTVNHK